jgi:hypothetical protein
MTALSLLASATKEIVPATFLAISNKSSYAAFFPLLLEQRARRYGAGLACVIVIARDLPRLAGMHTSTGTSVFPPLALPSLPFTESIKK